MELTYRKYGDYYIPNLTLRDTKEYSIGKYGWMRRSYLKEHRPFLFHELLVTERLMAHLQEIGEQLETMEKSMMAQEDVTEELKAADQMEWVRRCNSIRSRAEEVILRELVYA